MTIALVVLRLLKRPEPAENRMSLSLSYSLSHAPGTNHRATISNTILPKSTTRVSPGVWSDTKHRQLRQCIELFCTRENSRTSDPLL
jgi:hypothetical protein